MFIENLKGVIAFSFVWAFVIVAISIVRLYFIAGLKGKAFEGYLIVGNSCGVVGVEVLTSEGTGIKPIDVPKYMAETFPRFMDSKTYSDLFLLYSNAPNELGNMLKYTNPNATRHEVK